MEGYRNQYGPCARMTHKSVKRSILKCTTIPWPELLCPLCPRPIQVQNSSEELNSSLGQALSQEAHQIFMQWASPELTQPFPTLVYTSAQIQTIVTVPYSTVNSQTPLFKSSISSPKHLTVSYTQSAPNGKYKINSKN